MIVKTKKPFSYEWLLKYHKNQLDFLHLVFHHFDLFFQQTLFV